jgi:hypothetical protein
MVSRALSLWFLLFGPDARAGEPSPTASALAAAIRSYYDEGPREALARLDGLPAGSSQRGDVAWWRARCLLDLDRPPEALQVLGGERGGNIPAWRFDALRAQAAARSGAPEVALAAGAAAMGAAGGEPETDALMEHTRLLVAALAARAGLDDQALLALAGLPSPPPAIDLPPALLLVIPEADALLAAPLAPGARLPGPLAFEAAGSWWRLDAGGGLARRIAAPTGTVRECPGPDLCTSDGAPVLPAAGVRYAPSVRDGLLVYGAGHEPLAGDDGAAGIFAWEGGLAPPRRLTRAPEGAFDFDPAGGPEGVLLFLRRTGGHTRLLRLELGGEAAALAPDLTAVGGLAVVGDVAVMAAVLEGRGALRWLPLDAAADAPSQPLLAAAVEMWTPRALTPGSGTAGRW